MSTIYWVTAKDSSSESLESTMERSEDEVLDDEELLSEPDISMPVDSLLLESEDELESGW
jgi:hypothetical protein